MRKILTSIVAILLFALISFSPSFHLAAQETIDPELEKIYTDLPDELWQRAHKISKDLRCPICQGQNIAESDALIAKRLRIMLAEELHKGKTDAEIITYIKDRYGDYVSFKPPLKISTWLLWFGPLLLLLGTGWLASRKLSNNISAPLNEEEQD